MPNLPPRLAYTTVMTTMDRLYKKGLLKRRKVGKALHLRSRSDRARVSGAAIAFVGRFFNIASGGLFVYSASKSQIVISTAFAEHSGCNGGFFY
jgi:predicted transcriptional regulator